MTARPRSSSVSAQELRGRIADIDLARLNAEADHEAWKISGRVGTTYAYPEGMADEEPDEPRGRFAWMRRRDA